MKLLNTLAGGIVLVGGPLQASKVPQIQVPLSREGQLCQTIVENAEKALAYIQDPQPGPELELSNPLKPFMHDYTMIEQINLVFKGVVEESLKVNHGQTLLEAREELEEAKTTIGKKDSEIKRLEGLLPPSYNIPLTIVNIANGNLDQNFTLEDTDLRLMISAFPNNWADCNITPANIKSISVPNALKAWPQEVLNDCTNLEEFLTYGPESEDAGEGIALTTTGELESSTNDYFPHRDTLKTLQLPSFVTSIGNYAFYCCTGLTSVSFPALLTSIGNEAFYGCSRVTLDFSRCNQLSTIDKTILDEVTNFTLILPAHWTTVPESAFSSCTNITSVDLSKCTALTSVGSSAFGSCTGLISVTFPASLTSTGSNAFNSCKSLTSLDLSKNTALTSIEDNAFGSCTGLTSLDLSKCTALTSIGDDAFTSCTGLTSVAFPSSLASIGSRAFDNCPKLKSLIFPSALTSCGTSICSGCSEGTLDFSGCSQLNTIDKSTLDGGTNFTVILPAHWTTVPNSAFQNWTNIRSLIFSPALTSCEASICSGCSGVTLDFSGCSQLNTINKSTLDGGTDFTLISPSHWTTVLNNAFQYWTNITSLDLSKCTALTSIGSEAFYSCTGLISVTFPASLTSIGSNAFFWCPKLTSVNLSDCTKLTSIGTYVFQSCTGLNSVTFPASLTSIGNNAFWRCSGVTLDFSRCSQLSTIDKSTLDGSTDLALILPSHWTTVPSSAFKSCTNITSVDLSKCTALTSIKNWAFWNCSGLTSVDLSKCTALTSIEESAFNYCSGLTSITFPASLTSIGAGAFYSCSNLRTVYWVGSKKDIYDFGSDVQHETL